MAGYWGRVAIRAVKDTAKLFGWGELPKVALSVLLIGGGVFGAFYFGSTAAGVNELDSALRAAAVAFAAFPLVFVIYFISTPHRLDREARKEIESICTERNDLESQLHGKEGKKSALLALADKRAEGISLRNDGMKLSALSDLPEWIRKIEEWEQHVTKLIESFSPVEAKLFDRLDQYEPAKFIMKFLSDGHAKHIFELSERLTRLNKLIEKYAS